MPNGYGPAMRIFTKITKIPFSVLRMQDHTAVVCTEDSYLQGCSYKSCLKNVNDTIIMPQSLGFTIHPQKSVLKPKQNLIYLGFVTNSKDLTLNFTEEKRQKNFDLCPKHFEKSKPNIKFVTQVICNIVASFPAVPLGPLFHRTFETDKIVRVKKLRQNHDTEAELSNKACSEIVWLKYNVKISF